METKTINANDWTGNMTTYRYSKNRVKLENIELMFERFKQWIKVYFKYYGDDEWSYLTTIYKLEENEWCADELGVSREADNEYDVAVQMANNLI